VVKVAVPAIDPQPPRRNDHRAAYIHPGNRRGIDGQGASVELRQRDKHVARVSDCADAVHPTELAVCTAEVERPGGVNRGRRGWRGLLAGIARKADTSCNGRDYGARKADCKNMRVHARVRLVPEQGTTGTGRGGVDDRSRQRGVGAEEKVGLAQAGIARNKLGKNQLSEKAAGDTYLIPA
jgi:hypothetical protein